VKIIQVEPGHMGERASACSAEVVVVEDIGPHTLLGGEQVVAQ